MDWSRRSVDVCVNGKLIGLPVIRDMSNGSVSVLKTRPGAVTRVLKNLFEGLDVENAHEDEFCEDADVACDDVAKFSGVDASKLTVARV